MNTIKISRNVLESVLNSFKSVSDDATRYALNHVRIERNIDTLKIVACDGHQITIKTLSVDGNIEGLESGKAIHIASDNKKAIQTILKDTKKMTDFWFDIDCSNKRMGFLSYLTSRVLIEINDIAYPDYNKVVPNLNSGYDYQIEINPELILKAWESMGCPKGMTFNFRGSQYPLVAFSRDCQDKAIVMPMRSKGLIWGTPESSIKTA